MDRIGTDRIHLQGPGPVRGGSGSHPVCIWGVWIPLRGGGGDSPARSWIPLQKLRPSRCRAGSRRRAVGSDVCVAVCDPHICFLGGCLDPLRAAGFLCKGLDGTAGAGTHCTEGLHPAAGEGMDPITYLGRGEGPDLIMCMGGRIPLYACMGGLDPIICVYEGAASHYVYGGAGSRVLLRPLQALCPHGEGRSTPIATHGVLRGPRGTGGGSQSRAAIPMGVGGTSASDTALSLCPTAPEWPPRNGSSGRAWGGPLQSGAPINSTDPLGPQLEPPGGGPATADPTVGCMGCSGEGAASSVPPVPDAAQDPRLGVTGPTDGDGGVVALGSPEEVGSGEQPTRAGVGPTEGLTPRPPGLPSPGLGLSSPGPNLGLPSLDLPNPNLGLPDPNLGLPNPSLGLPSPGPTPDRPIPNPNPSLDLPDPGLAIQTPNLGLSNPNIPLPSPSPGPGTEPDLLPVAEDSEVSMELPQPSSSPAPAQNARGRTDRTWLGAPEPISAAPGTAEPPEIIDVDYYDVFDGGHGPGGGHGAGGAAQREPGGAATPWGLHELYDDFTPFDEADFYPTTSFYAEGDDDEEEELEEDEEEEEEEDGGLEDENGYRPPASAAPRVPPPPSPTEGTPMARPRPGERAVPENSSECRSGYVRHNSSCRSVCDLVPSYCHNGGQCYLVESHGAFCRYGQLQRGEWCAGPWP